MNRPTVTRMKLLLNAVFVFLATTLPIVLPSSVASAKAPVIPDRITVDSVNLTAQQFFNSFMSEDPDERKNAELYLLGVLDATEGKFWCDYQTFKTITLRERIFEQFKKLDGSQLGERASRVIENILSQRYPCGGKK